MSVSTETLKINVVVEKYIKMSQIYCWVSCESPVLVAVTQQETCFPFYTRPHTAEGRNTFIIEKSPGTHRTAAGATVVTQTHQIHD